VVELEAVKLAAVMLAAVLLEVEVAGMKAVAAARLPVVPAPAGLGVEAGLVL
jgi:hypothetical protein